MRTLQQNLRSWKMLQTMTLLIKMLLVNKRMNWEAGARAYKQEQVQELEQDQELKQEQDQEKEQEWEQP